MEAFNEKVEVFGEKVQEFDKNQVIRIKSGTSTTRGSLLYLGLLGDRDGLSNNISNLVTLYKKNYESIVKESK